MTTNGFMGADRDYYEGTFVDTSGLPQPESGGSPPEVLYYLRVRQEDRPIVSCGTCTSPCECIPGSVAITTPIWVAASECDSNGIPDGMDIANGLYGDCGGNGVPDLCEPDCNSNGTPDDCEPTGNDCNTNGVLDDCDIAGGTSTDCNENGTPDECESSLDCNTNGTPDDCEIQPRGAAPDCNSNGIPDECDTPRLVSAVSRRPNPSGPGEYCDSAAGTDGSCGSEPHQPGITEMRFIFDDDATGTCLSSLEEATCAAPTFVPYQGVSEPNCAPSGNELICTFSPALENGRTYRFNVTGGSAMILGLVGDVNSDGSVNALDRSVVVGAWTGSGFTCQTDLDNSGATNAVDRSIVVGAWTGGDATNCAPCQSAKVVARSFRPTLDSRTPENRLGSKRPIRPPHPFNRPRRAMGERWDRAAAWIEALREGLSAKSGSPGGSDDGGAEGAWIVVSGTASLEVRPIGGGIPADTLIVG